MDIQMVVGASTLYQMQTENTDDVSQTKPIDATQEDQSEDSALTFGGDRVTISEEGRQQAKSIEGGSLEEDREQEDSEKEQRVKEIKQRIEEIQQELTDISKDNSMAEDVKQKKTQALTQELLELNSELSELQTSSSGNAGGTSAEGMANSLT